MVGARSGGTSTPFSAECARAQIADRLAALLAPVRDGDVRAHFAQALSIRPVRRGFSITPSTVISEPGTISAATSGNAADDGIARHRDRAPASIRPRP